MIRLASLRTSIGILAIVICSAGCFGASRVSYVDSSRTKGPRSSDEKIGERPNTQVCGKGGPATVTTYASIGDRIVRALTMQLSQPRHIEIVCAKED